MGYLTIAAFFGVTCSHCVLTPYWLKRAWGAASSREELLFQSIVFAFGSLQAILHILACTVGISLGAGVVALILLHAAAYVWVTWRGQRLSARPKPTEPTPTTAAVTRTRGRKTRRVSPPEALAAPTHGVSPWKVLANVPWLTLVGTTGIAACVLSWLARAPQSLQVLGIDSRHYHVPYAVNYAHGLNLFGYLATPHLYPVGASILGAWFFQPVSDPLFLDLVNLLPCVLLFASLAFLFTLLTNESGLEWVPFVFLLLFTGKMFRVSMFISADMLYCAAFAAAFTQLCSMWIHDRTEARDLLTLALATGMLLSSKIQGLIGAVLLLGFFTLAVTVRALWRREVPRISWSFLLLVWCAVLLLASGGIWLVRNWLYFGSPMAPAGFKLFGVQIFAGSPGTGDWLSIGKDMRDIPGYNLPVRFLARSREWVGAWPAFVTLGVLGLVADAIHAVVTRRGPSPVFWRKLFALLLFAALFAVHGYILIFTVGTSIEILNGQTVRYIIPFYALFPLLMYALFFSATLPWVRAAHLQWLLLPGFVYLLYHYNDLTQMPMEWNRAYGAEDLLDYRLIPLALVLVLPWCVEVAPPWQRYGRWGTGAVAACALLLFATVAASEHATAMIAARATFEQELQGFQRGRPATNYRGTLLHVVAHQRQHGESCRQNRFFMASRFDYPLDLQDPAFSNLVLDVRGDTLLPSLLARDGPGAGPCDYIVAAFQDFALSADTTIPAVSDDEVRHLVMRGNPEVVGDSGGYRIYHVRVG